MNLLGIVGLVVALLFGIVSIIKPEQVFRVIAIWGRFVGTADVSEDQRLKDAFANIDTPDRYVIIFPRVMLTIKRTGFLALFIAIIGFCLILFGSPVK